MRPSTASSECSVGESTQHAVRRWLSRAGSAQTKRVAPYEVTNVTEPQFPDLNSEIMRMFNVSLSLQPDQLFPMTPSCMTWSWKPE